MKSQGDHRDANFWNDLPWPVHNSQACRGNIQTTSGRFIFHASVTMRDDALLPAGPGEARARIPADLYPDESDSTDPGARSRLTRAEDRPGRSSPSRSHSKLSFEETKLSRDGSLRGTVVRNWNLGVPDVGFLFYVVVEKFMSKGMDWNMVFVGRRIFMVQKL